MSGQTLPLDTTEPVYTLTVTATQLGVIRDACEVTSRVSMAQLDSVAFGPLAELPSEVFCEVRDGLSRLNPLVDAALTPDMRELADTAWVLYHATRYRLYLDGCAERGEAPDPTTVLSRPPTRRGVQPVPEVQRAR